MAHTEFNTQISQNGTQFELTFKTTEKRYFLAMQGLARKCIDNDFPEPILTADIDRHALKIARELGDEENVAHYEQKLNSLFNQLFVPQVKMYFDVTEMLKYNCTEEVQRYRGENTDEHKQH